MTTEASTRNRRLVAEWRRRNTEAGLCQCGHVRFVNVETGRRYRSCETCLAKSSRMAPRRVHFRFAADMDPAQAGVFMAFCTEFGIPPSQALDDALDLYMAVTRRHEPEHPKPVIEEGREAYV